MKKSLYLTSALVAASVLALGSTATMAASKAKPMKIGVSGSYKALVGYAKQQSAFEVPIGTPTSSNSYNAIDVKTDSEVHFKGSTKLDNGLTVGVGIELESDQASTATIDGSYVTIGGGFGTLLLGNSVAASAAMSVNAPNTGAVGTTGPDLSAWVVAPAAVPMGAAGANIGGGDAAKIRWMSKSFSGFTVGASYVPSNTSSNGMPVNGGNSAEVSQQDAAVKYSGKMGASTVNAGFNVWSTDAGTASVEAWSTGVSVGMGAFTVGMGYKDVDSTARTATNAAVATSATSANEEAINVGASWAQGATTLSLAYFNSEKPLSTAVAGADEVTKWVLGAKYNMGPGVDLLGTVANVKWQDESSATAANNNKGVAVIGGIAVAF
jgi:hypothetical protein